MTMRPLLLLLAIFGLADPVTASFTQSDHVAETNLALGGASVQSFSGAADTINRFNGALSYTIPIGPTYPVGGYLHYQLRLRYTSQIWDFDLDPQAGTVTAAPGRRFNAGMGWALSFGELLPPASVENPSQFWTYRDPSGSRSRFYTSLDEGGPGDPGIYYSRDSRFLRLRIAGNDAHVDFPGGRTSSFAWNGTQWRFAADRDVFSNEMTVDESTPGQWVVSDSHGRTHRIFFTPDPAGHYPAVIDRVEVAAFGGTTASYSFRYQIGTVQFPAQDDDPGTPVSLALPTLVGVDGPLGNSHDFLYWLPPGAGAIESGRLREVTVPAGGKIRYRYEAVALPFLADAEHTADAVGVWRRRTLTNDLTLLGTWRLLQALDIPRVVGTLDQPRELTRTVVFPDGHTEVHKFSVYVSGNGDNDQTPPERFDERDYGFAFTVHGASAGDPYRLSTEVFEADGTKLQSRWFRLETTDCAGCWDRLPRVSAHRTLTLGAGVPNLQTDVVHSEYDGLGQFRTTTTSDSQGTILPRILTRGIALPGMLPGTAAPWILNPSSGSTIAQGLAQKVTEQCRDAATGLLLRKRIRASGTAREAHDLVRTYAYDAAGNRTTTRYYGSDVQGLGTQAELCDLVLPAQEQFAEFQETQYGTPSRGGWLAAGGSVFLETYAAVIDPNTGLPTSRHSGDGLWWTFSHDALGRQILSTPPAGHDGPITTMTFPPGESIQLVQDGNGTVLKETRTEFGFFQEVSVIHRNTVSGWTTAHFERDPMGRLTRTTDPESRVTETTYDALGRPTQEVLPGGPRFSRTHSYGPGSASRTCQIGKEWDEANNSVTFLERTTTESRDALGRLISRRIEDADGEWKLETFLRNLEGEILTTTVTDGAGIVVFQHPDRTDQRSFVVEDSQGNSITGYNALGNLTLQNFGEGVVFHQFDRAGRLTQQREGSAAGRLITKYVYGTGNSGTDIRQGKLHIASRYNYEIPHVSDGQVTVHETYTYQGSLGRLSKITSEVFAGAGDAVTLLSFEAGQTTDAAGNLDTLTYPDCLPAPGSSTVTCTPLPQRRLAFHQTLGALTRLSGSLGPNFDWISQVTYDAAGFITSRVLGNGFVETAVADASGAGRLAGLTLSHPTSGTFYDSGSAEYDGHGRLVQLGGRRHISDLAYSLALPAPPPDAGTPGNLTLPPGLRDALGQERRRSYTVPFRGGSTSQDGVEEVTEVYVYSPRGRLWTRTFNDFDAWNFNRSADEWDLRGPDGRVIRSRKASSHYQGLNQVTFANAQLANVKMTDLLTDDGDRIYLGGRLIGTSSDAHTSTGRKIYHRNIQGHLLAVSLDDGSLEPTAMQLH